MYVNDVRRNEDAAAVAHNFTPSAHLPFSFSSCFRFTFMC